ncbi:MAG: SRPBCC domain-containing protein [Proteobacteria bacterium]|nr:SRPBCC domain-containing protein [Pseudomonadota bacterium]
MADAVEEFTISRVFEAPRALVFKTFTDAAHLARWFGPKGFTMQACKLDLRPGGVFHYGMRSPDGFEMWGKWTFREIVEPERLVVIVSFSDKDGGITRHPMSPNWPLETLSTTTFVDLGTRTELKLRWAPHNATEEERKTFAAGHDGMRMGWGGTCDQLAAYLAGL